MFRLWDLFNVKPDDSVHFFDGHGVFVGTVTVGDNDFGLDWIDVCAGIGDYAIGAIRVGEIKALEVSDDRMGFDLFSKGEVNCIFYIL